MLKWNHFLELIFIECHS